MKKKEKNIENKAVSLFLCYTVPDSDQAINRERHACWARVIGNISLLVFVTRGHILFFFCTSRLDKQLTTTIVREGAMSPNHSDVHDIHCLLPNKMSC